MTNFSHVLALKVEVLGNNPITKEEQKKIMNRIGELFDQGGRKDEKHL